jgi:hypothetical protein
MRIYDVGHGIFELESIEIKHTSNNDWVSVAVVGVVTNDLAWGVADPEELHLPNAVRDQPLPLRRQTKIDAGATISIFLGPRTETCLNRIVMNIVKLLFQHSFGPDAYRQRITFPYLVLPVFCTHIVIFK